MSSETNHHCDDATLELVSLVLLLSKPLCGIERRMNWIATWHYTICCLDGMKICPEHFLHHQTLVICLLGLNTPTDVDIGAFTVSGGKTLSIRPRRFLDDLVDPIQGESYRCRLLVSGIVRMVSMIC